MAPRKLKATWTKNTHNPPLEFPPNPNLIAFELQDWLELHQLFDPTTPMTPTQHYITTKLQEKGWNPKTTGHKSQITTITNGHHTILIGYHQQNPTKLQIEYHQQEQPTLDHTGTMHPAFHGLTLDHKETFNPQDPTFNPDHLIQKAHQWLQNAPSPTPPPTTNSQTTQDTQEIPTLHDKTQCPQSSNS